MKNRRSKTSVKTSVIPKLKAWLRNTSREQIIELAAERSAIAIFQMGWREVFLRLADEAANAFGLAN